MTARSTKSFLSLGILVTRLRSTLCRLPPLLRRPLNKDARAVERELFEGLAKVKTFPIDPVGPGQDLTPNKDDFTPDGRSIDFDPIENVMRLNPGLTAEEAEEMATAFGF